MKYGSIILLIAAACARDTTSPALRSACTTVHPSDAVSGPIANDAPGREAREELLGDTAALSELLSDTAGFSLRQRTLEDFSRHFVSLAQSDRPLLTDAPNSNILDSLMADTEGTRLWRNLRLSRSSRRKGPVEVGAYLIPLQYDSNEGYSTGVLVDGSLGIFGGAKEFMWNWSQGREQVAGWGLLASGQNCQERGLVLASWTDAGFFGNSHGDAAGYLTVEGLRGGAYANSSRGS
jgi:hypothetical protein